MGSVLSSGLVIEEDNLGVLVAFNFGTRADTVLVSSIQVRVDVDHFSITTVTEEETSIGVRINLEVW